MLPIISPQRRQGTKPPKALVFTLRLRGLAAITASHFGFPLYAEIEGVKYKILVTAIPRVQISHIENGLLYYTRLSTLKD